MREDLSFRRVREERKHTLILSSMEQTFDRTIWTTRLRVVRSHSAMVERLRTKISKVTRTVHELHGMAGRY